MANTPVPHYAVTHHFTNNLGTFYGMWLALEAAIDYTIGNLLRLSHIETHILTAGMEFGRKANLLRILMSRSSHPQKDKVIPLLNKIQQESKRNIFAHSLLTSDDNSVTFVHRKTEGNFSATQIRFTKTEFEIHVKDIIRTTNEFGLLLAIDLDDFQAFGAAALSASKSPITSPQPSPPNT